MEDYSGQSENKTEEKPKRYLGLAVVSTLFFWPLGIVSIFKALKVDDYIAMNNKEMAFYASRDAKRFGIIALIIGLIGYVFVFCIAVIAILVSQLA